VLKKTLSVKKKVVSFAVILAGIIGILCAIIITPEFAAKYISSDYHLEIKTIELLQSYRLLSSITGCFLLLMSFLIYRFPERYIVFPYILAQRTLLLIIIVYLLLFGYNTLTRTHDFGYHDGMNYVDVARNIATGRGIVQSALGFNQRLFSIDDQIPMPLTVQPPLYPLLIALFSLIGISYAKAGLLISIICYGLILLMIYRISFEIYDVRAALLSVVFLLLYAPLYKVSKTTLSEPTSIVLLLITLWLLIKICSSGTYRAWFPAGAGLTTGLAFSARYAMLPLLPLGILFVALESRRKLRDLSLYIGGFIIPAGLVLIRNFLVSGEFFSTRNPSTIGFKDNVFQAFKAIAGEYSNILNPNVQIFIICIALLILCILIAKKHKLLDTIKSVFVRKERYLLTIWALGYLTFFVLVGTRVFLSPINWRMIMPVKVIIVILFSALIIKTIEIKTQYLICMALIIALFMVNNEVLIAVKKPVFDRDKFVANSGRLSWIEQHTTRRDLIIGDGAVDIAFYLNRPALISFSPYPEAVVPEYKRIIGFCNKHCNEYENIYIVVSNPEYLLSHVYDMEESGPNDQEKKLERFYGSFISDLIYGKLQKYPAVSFLDRLSDTYIFKINCQP